MLGGAPPRGTHPTLSAPPKSAALPNPQLRGLTLPPSWRGARLPLTTGGLITAQLSNFTQSHPRPLYSTGPVPLPRPGPAQPLSRPWPHDYTHRIETRYGQEPHPTTPPHPPTAITAYCYSFFSSTLSNNGDLKSYSPLSLIVCAVTASEWHCMHKYIVPLEETHTLNIMIK